MIEGLHFDVPFEEMKKRLLIKVTHHLGRADWYRARVSDLKAGSPNIDHNVTGGNPVSQLESRAETHQNRAEFFTFMADHLIKGETYRLSERDLITLEFISGGRF